MAGFLGRLLGKRRKAHPDEARSPSDALSESRKPLGDGPAVSTDRAAVERLSRALTILATEVWRTRTRLAKLSEPERAPVRTIEVSSDKMLAALESLGIRIDDPTGRTWDERDAVTVLVFEPTDGVSRAVVAETVKPTLFLGESLLAPGEVVVAVPREKANDG